MKQKIDNLQFEDTITEPYHFSVVMQSNPKYHMQNEENPSLVEVKSSEQIKEELKELKDKFV